jgi:hypothetical protein
MASNSEGENLFVLIKKTEVRVVKGKREKKKKISVG